MRRRSLRTWILTAILLAAGGGAFWYFTTRPLPVDVAEIARGPIRASVEEEGKTRVVDRYVISAPVSGRLLRLDLKEGDEIQKGQTVATIDPLEARSRVAQAQARADELRQRLAGVGRKRPKPEELQRARALAEGASHTLLVAGQELEEAREAWELARLEAERARNLIAEGSASPSERDAAVTSERRAAARVAGQEALVQLRRVELRAARLDVRILEASTHDVDWEEAAAREAIAGVDAELQVLRDDLERTDVTAPAAGTVLRRLEESQTVLPAGTPILEIGDLGRIEAEADFLSGDAARMRPGMAVEISGRSFEDDAIEGMVTRIYPSAFTKISSLGVEQQRVTVVARFDAGVIDLGDRYRVDVRVILESREDAVLVPEAALFRHEGRWAVWRIDDAGRARLASVETGLEDGRSREVLSGLEPGNRVVIFPGSDVTEGARVRSR